MCILKSPDSGLGDWDPPCPALRQEKQGHHSSTVGKMVAVS